MCLTLASELVTGTLAEGPHLGKTQLEVGTVMEMAMEHTALDQSWEISMVCQRKQLQ